MVLFSFLWPAVAISDNFFILPALFYLVKNFFEVFLKIKLLAEVVFRDNDDYYSKIEIVCQELFSIFTASLQVLHALNSESFFILLFYPEFVKLFFKVICIFLF